MINEKEEAVNNQTTSEKTPQGEFASDVKDQEQKMQQPDTQEPEERHQDNPSSSETDLSAKETSSEKMEETPDTDEKPNPPADTTEDLDSSTTVESETINTLDQTEESVSEPITQTHTPEPEMPVAEQTSEQQNTPNLEARAELENADLHQEKEDTAEQNPVTNQGENQAEIENKSSETQPEDKSDDGSSSPNPAIQAEAEPSSTDATSEENTDTATPVAEDEDKQEDEKEEEEEDDSVDDFSSFDKEGLFALIQKLAKEEDYRKYTPILREIRPLFDELVNEEKQKALDKYLAEGGEKDGFEFKEDQITQDFYTLYNHIQKSRTEQIAQIEATKEKNLQKKNELLEKMRALTENEESQASIEELKKLQQEWREVGPVAHQHNRSLWASYNALVDLFYDKRSIYYELKELDRKKNLAQKLGLCERAEKLVEYESIKDAVKELNELHEEFKHIGPVPKEEQEALWQRFKAASDRVYDKKREHIRQREQEKQENLEKKLVFCERIKPFAEFQSDKISEWNAKTKEILALQKDWEAIRFVPRDKIKELSRLFWTPFKTFFNNKNAFIKTLDEEREENLKQKTVLCEEVEALVDGETEDSERQVAEKLKTLQKKWKEIGPVPSKQRQSIYDRFKKTCDKFFERRRERYAAQEREYAENLQKKQALCEKIETHQPEASDQANQLVEAYIEEWKEIGFVPKKDKNSIQKRFDKAIEGFIKRFPDMGHAEKEEVSLTAELNMFQESPYANKKIKQKESVIRRKISKLENDIDTLRNNIGFLANSKKADKLKESLEQQIKDASVELEGLRAQLKVLRNA